MHFISVFTLFLIVFDDSYSYRPQDVFFAFAHDMTITYSCHSVTLILFRVVNGALEYLSKDLGISENTVLQGKLFKVGANEHTIYFLFFWLVKKWEKYKMHLSCHLILPGKPTGGNVLSNMVNEYFTSKHYEGSFYL